MMAFNSLIGRLSFLGRTGERLTSTSSGIKNFQQGWTQEAKRQLMSCVEARVSS
jgi:hypothetical protein